MNNENPNRDQFRTITRIWPHRSLSKRGFAIVMLALGCLAFFIGLGFFLLGAWPVIGFLGLELLVVWGAFKLNYRAARKQQTITVTNSELAIETTHPSGKTETVTLPTAWVRIAVTPQTMPEMHSRYQQKITVSSHGQSVTIGDFLHPAEVPRLAAHLNTTIERARDITPTGRRH